MKRLQSTVLSRVITIKKSRLKALSEALHTNF